MSNRETHTQANPWLSALAAIGIGFLAFGLALTYDSHPLPGVPMAIIGALVTLIWLVTRAALWHPDQ